MENENKLNPLTLLSEDEEFFRTHIADFAKSYLKPLVMEMDEAAKVKPEVLAKLHELGLMAIEIPESLGGAGGTFFQSIIAIEELAKVDPTISVIVDVQNTLVINAFMNFSSQAVQDKFLPKLASGSIGAYALSESSSGSDAFALKCRAIDRGDGTFLLKGSKLWITNGNEASIYIIMANAKPEAGYKGITAFVVEKGMPGFSVGKKENKLGIRASSTCELILDDCIVPKENIIGEVGKGYKVAIETLNEGRIGIAAQMLGLSEGALFEAIHYAKSREQFGKPIASFQAIQHELAKMAVDVQSAKLMVYNAARLKQCGMEFRKDASMAKYHASQVAESVSSRALEIFGGNGFVKEYPMEKYFRDSKIGKIYEGTSFMQLSVIAKDILGD